MDHDRPISKEKGRNRLTEKQGAIEKKIKLKRLPPTTKAEAGIFLYSRPFGGEFKLVPNLEAMSKNGLLSQTGLR